MGLTGWLNDPNGPLFFNDRYHLCFQHLPHSSVWTFGIMWGHVVSRNLVRWLHMPEVLLPHADAPDADGSFSGCTAVDEDGIPTALYTGVFLRNNPKLEHLLPHEDDDLGLPFVESQIYAAHADPKDPLLTVWKSLEKKTTMLPRPPAELRPASRLMGWRDPYIFERPCAANGWEYGLLMGCGLRDAGGCVLVYRSKKLTSGWRYAGMLCQAKHQLTGAMWECPVMFPLHPLPGTVSRADATHVLLISPDAPIHPVIYWTGRYQDGTFDLDHAQGPYRLDLGNTVYAVNTLETPAEGGATRTLLWAWVQEKHRPNDESYSYAGCLSVPREVWVRPDGRLFQRPLPQLADLRGAELLGGEDIEVGADQVAALQATSSAALELSLTMQRSTSVSAGIWVGSWREGGTGGAVIVYDWRADALQAIFDSYAVDAESGVIRQQANELGRASVVGGKLGTANSGEGEEAPNQELQLHVLIDGSCVEVFTSTGAALTVRVYRGLRPAGETAAKVGLVSLGGAASFSAVHAWELGSCWEDPASVLREQPEAAVEPREVTISDHNALDKPYGTVRVGRCNACSGNHRKGECSAHRDIAGVACDCLDIGFGGDGQMIPACSDFE